MLHAVIAWPHGACGELGIRRLPAAGYMAAEREHEVGMEEII